MINGRTEIDSLRIDFEAYLEKGLSQSDTFKPKPLCLNGKWKDMVIPNEIETVDTGTRRLKYPTSSLGVAQEDLVKIGLASVQVPERMVSTKRHSQLILL